MIEAVKTHRHLPVLESFWQAHQESVNILDSPMLHRLIEDCLLLDGFLQISMKGQRKIRHNFKRIVQSADLVIPTQAIIFHLQGQAQSAVFVGDVGTLKAFPIALAQT